MPPNMRPLLRVARLQSAISRAPQFQRAYASGTTGGSSGQAFPIGPYYEEILPKPQAKPQPKPEVKPEVKPETKPKVEAKPEPKPEVKIEAKPQPKPEIKAEIKPEATPKVEAKPEIKTEVKTEIKPKVEAKPQPKPEVKAEAKPQPKSEVKPEVEAKPKPRPEAKSKAKLEVKPEEPAAPSPKARSTAKKSGGPKAKRNPGQSGAIPPSSSASPSASLPGTITTATTPPTTVPPQPSAEPATAQEKARIVFGSRLAGPAERADRLQSIRDRSTRIAGILVPPRPEEPENCCMSGCVNCVWDRYRDEMEEWAAASALAEEALRAERTRGPAVETTPVSPSSTAPSMDDDGGGSETNWTPGETAKRDHPKIAKDFWDDDLYNNVPVGIREFMKHEKKLKEKHKREGTFGG